MLSSGKLKPPIIKSDYLKTKSNSLPELPGLYKEGSPNRGRIEIEVTERERTMADDLKGKLDTEVELKSSAHEFFNFWRGQVHQTPNHTPANVQEIKLHEGDWESSGSIKIWHYTLGAYITIFPRLAFSFIFSCILTIFFLIL